jgi:hypothetical protein
VTVVGKGGRPRKWRSDTDLVRAYRSRQRGGEEPPTVDEALDAGDDAAIAWNRVRELETAVEALRRETELSKASVREPHKALDQERVRFGWINEENIRLRSEVEALRTGRNASRRNVAGGARREPSHTLDHTHLAMGVTNSRWE